MPPKTDHETTEQEQMMQVVMDQLAELRGDLKHIASDVQDVKVALAKREQDSTEVTRLRDKVESLSTEVTALKVKSGVWGFAAGLLPAMAAVLFMLLQ